MAETQENNTKLDGSLTADQVIKKNFTYHFLKNIRLILSVRKFKKNLNDVVKKKMELN